MTLNLDVVVHDEIHSLYRDTETDFIIFDCSGVLSVIGRWSSVVEAIVPLNKQEQAIAEERVGISEDTLLFVNQAIELTPTIERTLQISNLIIQDPDDETSKRRILAVVPHGEDSYKELTHNFIVYTIVPGTIGIIGKLVDKIRALNDTDAEIAKRMGLQITRKTLTCTQEPSENQCNYTIPRGSHVDLFCLNKTADDSEYCEFHADLIDKRSHQVKYQSWADTIIPYEQHCHLKYDQFPKLDYEEYREWCQDNKDDSDEDDSDEEDDLNNEITPSSPVLKMPEIKYPIVTPKLSGIEMYSSDKMHKSTCQNPEVRCQNPEVVSQPSFNLEDRELLITANKLVQNSIKHRNLLLRRRISNLNGNEKAFLDSIITNGSNAESIIKAMCETYL